jgi:hypothetical protein
LERKEKKNKKEERKSRGERKRKERKKKKKKKEVRKILTKKIKFSKKWACVWNTKFEQFPLKKSSKALKRLKIIYLIVLRTLK